MSARQRRWGGSAQPCDRVPRSWPGNRAACCGANGAGRARLHRSGRLNDALQLANLGFAPCLIPCIVERRVRPPRPRRACVAKRAEECVVPELCAPDRRRGRPRPGGPQQSARHPASLEPERPTLDDLPSCAGFVTVASIFLGPQDRGHSGTPSGGPSESARPSLARARRLRPPPSRVRSPTFLRTTAGLRHYQPPKRHTRIMRPVLPRK